MTDNDKQKSAGDEPEKKQGEGLEMKFYVGGPAPEPSPDEKLRLEAKRGLHDFLKRDDSLFTADLVAYILGFDRRSVFRWIQSSAPWLPSVSNARRILRFLRDLEDVREIWRDVIKGKDKNPLFKFPDSALTLVMGEPFVELLFRRDLTPDEILEGLVVEFARANVERAKKSRELEPENHE